jgi:hypothetical protein
LDAELLEHAGFLTPSATPTERTRFAEKLAEDACASRCGDECCGVCRVRAFVVTEAHGTDFYFGAHEEIAAAVLTSASACDVYIWDELEHNTMHKLTRQLDLLLETVPGLAMRTTALKTVPGQVSLLAAAPSLCAGLTIALHDR